MQIFSRRATDAPIHGFNDRLLGMLLLFNQFIVDRNGSVLIFYNGNFFTVLLFENTIQ